MIDDQAPATESDFPMAPNDLRVAIRAYTEGLKRDLKFCFPCCVYSYDRTTHKATVMPLVKQAYFNGEWIYLRRSTFQTTVRNIQAGGFTIDFPLYVGDTGWVFSSDRDTMLLKREGGLTNSVLEGNRKISVVEDSYQQKPNTPALHSLTHGFFLPDNWGRWESFRFKDDPGVSIGEALYIGSSFDTKDEDDVGGQTGDMYEHKSSSSLVLQKNGGAYLLSSTNTEPEDAIKLMRTAKVASVGDTVELAVKDATKETPRDASLSIGIDSGIVIRQDNLKEKLHFIASIQEDQLTIRLMDIQNKKTVSMSFENGQFHLMTSDAINIFAQKDVNIKGAEHAYVSSKEARVVAQNDASVAAKNVSASAEENVNIAAGRKINLTAPEELNIVTASNVTVMAKKKGANISVVSKSKDSNISVTTEGKNSPITIATKEKDSSISINTEKDNSKISLVTAGKADIEVKSEQAITIEAKKDITVNTDENVNVTAGKEVKIQAGKNASVYGENVYVSSSGDATVSAGGKATLSGSDVDISGSTVNISGDTKINGQAITYNRTDKHWV